VADFKLSDTIACYPVNLTRLTTWFWTSRGSALLLPASSHSIVISGREERREDAMERVHYAHHEKIIPRPRSTLNLSWNIKVILQRHQTCFRVLLFIVSIMLRSLTLANIKTDGWRLLKFSQRKNIIVFFFVCCKWRYRQLIHLQEDQEDQEDHYTRGDTQFFF